jgi:hypothetical protein
LTSLRDSDTIAVSSSTYTIMESKMKDRKNKNIDSENYSEWIRHQGDVDFDFKWHIMQVCAGLLALVGSFFFIIHITIL